MQVEAHGLICDPATRPPSERVASFVGISLTKSGAILCAFQIGAIKNAPQSTLLLFRSRDKGRTWQEIGFRFATTLAGIPGSLSSGEIVEVSPGRLLLIATWFDRRDPSRPFFDPVTEGILPSKQLMAISTNEGDDWTPWRELPIPNFKGRSGTGPILKWTDGTIAYAFETLKECDDPNPAVPGAWCVISRDGGETFGQPVLTAQDPHNQIYYWDQRLCAGPAVGDFVALYWTYDRENKKDLAVHLRRASLLRGDLHTAPIVPTSMPGQIAAPCLLKDGRLLAFVVERFQPGTMTLWSSRDSGATWGNPLIVHTHDERAALTQSGEDIDYAQYWEDMGKWSFGHPAILPLGGDKVLLAYYAGTPDCTKVRWARVTVAVEEEKPLGERHEESATNLNL